MFTLNFSTLVKQFFSSSQILLFSINSLSACTTFTLSYYCISVYVLICFFVISLLIAVLFNFNLFSISMVWYFLCANDKGVEFILLGTTM